VRPSPELVRAATASTHEDQLAWPDTVAGRKGRRATEAAHLARGERLAEVRRHLDANKSLAALVACERAFPSWKAAWQSDREVQALRARVHDLAFTDCADDICRFDSIAKAQAAAPTPERTARADELRRQMVESLTFRVVLDARRRCRGVYAAGKRGARALPSSGTWSAERLLSQAVGQITTIKKPAARDGTVRWLQGTTPVVVRWREGRPIEMRVGKAAP
jgi:hypothetical protein